MEPRKKTTEKRDGVEEVLFDGGLFFNNASVFERKF